MKETEKLRDALETLKAFNNAIMTVRLYPPQAPRSPTRLNADTRP